MNVSNNRSRLNNYRNPVQLVPSPSGLSPTVTIVVIASYYTEIISVK